jgi:hypothetical protein
MIFGMDSRSFAKISLAKALRIQLGVTSVFRASSGLLPLLSRRPQCSLQGLASCFVIASSVATLDPSSGFSPQLKIIFSKNSTSLRISLCAFPNDVWQSSGFMLSKLEPSFLEFPFNEILGWG